MKPQGEVLFLNPLVGDLYEFTRPNRPLPLGLLAACSYLAPDWRATILDQRLDPDWRARAREILRRRPVFVGLSVMGGPQIREALALSRWVKSVSDAPVVWGGVFPSLAPEVVLRDAAVDVVVQGEGERAAPELAAALSGGVSLKEVPGLWFKEGGAILRSEPRPFGDLAAYPRLPYGLVDVPKYNFSLASGPEAGRLKLVMETSRGCSYACVYCYNPIFYRNSWRARTAEHVVEEIDFLHREYGAASIDFLDDDLFERPERVVAVAEGLLARGVAISWLANGVTILSLDRLSDADLRTLSRSGLAMVNFGAESGSDRLLERMGRGARVADIERINRRLSGIGIRPAFYFSTGMEGETEEELRSTVDLMLRLTETNPEAKIIASFCLTPFPGTALTRAAERAGAALPRTLEEWAGFDSTRAMTPWLTRRRRRAMHAIFFLALFADGKIAEVAGSPAARLAARLYAPVARLRLRRLALGFLLEGAVVNAVLRLLDWRARRKLAAVEGAA